MTFGEVHEMALGQGESSSKTKTDMYTPLVKLPKSLILP